MHNVKQDCKWRAPRRSSYALQRHSELSTCHTNSQSTRRGDFTHAHNKCTALRCADFHETHKCPTALCAGLWYRISPKSVNKCEEFGQQIIHILNWSLAVTAPISTVLILVWQMLVNSPYTEFHKNQTNGLVLDTGHRRADGRMNVASIYIFLFYFMKNAKITS